MQATLENLAKIIEVKTDYNCALVMENPAVFTAIADRLQEKRVPIICTYGQVKLAGILLLKLLEKNCETIYYSGDIDPEGIQIADKLKAKFPDTIQLLGFHKEAYHQNLSNITLSRERLHKLEKLESEELIELAKEVKKEGKASYEELNIEEIMAQIEKV